MSSGAASTALQSSEGTRAMPTPHIHWLRPPGTSRDPLWGLTHQSLDHLLVQVPEQHIMDLEHGVGSWGQQKERWYRKDAPHNQRDPHSPSGHRSSHRNFPGRGEAFQTRVKTVRFCAQRNRANDWGMRSASECCYSQFWWKILQSKAGGIWWEGQLAG